MLRDQRDLAAAIEHYGRALLLDPDQADALFDRGSCHIKMGSFLPGIMDFTRAIEKRPGFATQLFSRAGYLAKVIDLPKQLDEITRVCAPSCQRRNTNSSPSH
jgi:tetratricopeptide (TPR) repeat protein